MWADRGRQVSLSGPGGRLLTNPRAEKFISVESEQAGMLLEGNPDGQRQTGSQADSGVKTTRQTSVHRYSCSCMSLEPGQSGRPVEES